MSDKKRGVQLLGPDEWSKSRGIIATMRKWLSEYQTTSVEMTFEELQSLSQQAYDKFGIVPDTGFRNRLTADEWRTYQSLVARGVDPDDALESALDGVYVHDVREEFRKCRDQK